MEIKLTSAMPRPKFAPAFAEQVDHPERVFSFSGDIATRLGLTPIGMGVIPGSMVVPLPAKQTGLTPDETRDTYFKLASHAVRGISATKPLLPSIAPGITTANAFLASYEAWDAWTEKEDFSRMNAGIKTVSLLADAGDLMMLIDPIANLHPNLKDTVQVFGIAVKIADSIYSFGTDYQKLQVAARQAG